MRYAIFTDIHANLEALEAVLAKIDAIDKEKPIDQVWFLGDLVGYGPNPNECITTLRERTDVIIAGNHDWAAVGKIDLEDFSAAARISAEWTAEQLTEEHRTFLANLPERLDIDECTLVHGSPYGPLWEYLTSEVLAERSFQYFSSRYCFVGHTHVPVIFQQPDTIANAPTLPLGNLAQNGVSHAFADDDEEFVNPDDEEINNEETDGTAEMVVIQPTTQTSKLAAQAESAYADPNTGQAMTEAEANAMKETNVRSSDQPKVAEATSPAEVDTTSDEETTPHLSEEGTAHLSGEAEEHMQAINTATHDDGTAEADRGEPEDEDAGTVKDVEPGDVSAEEDDDSTPDDTEGQHLTGEVVKKSEEVEQSDETTPEAVILNAEDRLNSEIEELLTLLGLSESMIQVTNEMIVPPEGHWEAPGSYRAIINPGGVGQPRDGDPRAAFMIYDTEEEGFEFYRIPYAFNLTQEKILKAGLPQYLAVRLAYGR
ncbi:MAG TPA: metallophosphoesterase family protein [Ktedonobacteraceae bacterium]|nr:metallophosphoesterase family protein [Ktedonobacteraceae bacterium]